MPLQRIQIFVSLEEDEAETRAQAMRRAGLDPDLALVRVVRRSLDARKGFPLGFHVELEIGASAVDFAETKAAVIPAPARARAGAHVVIVGTGPCGTFAAERLIEAGARVTLVEAGKPVQPRRHDVAALTQRGELNPSSNYCFGEGGAGTFSDGKLYTRVKDRPAVRSVLASLVRHGASPEILVESRPHVGSNKLPKILLAQRAALESKGAIYVWSDAVDDLLLRQGRVIGVRCLSGREIAADAVVLAIGHSARPLYFRLLARGVALEAKAFAVGTRIEHPQPLINRMQYGRAAGHPKLPPAFYQVAAQVNGRGVYSFCMCPGGWIVDSSTEPGALCTNGMSLSRRDSPLANAALVVAIEPRDYLADYGQNALAGIELQRAIERRAFELGGGSFAAPAQQVVDFIRKKSSSETLPSTYRPRIKPGDMRGALPAFVVDALAGALGRWQKTLPGFVDKGAQFVGVETRSSSPVRIVRDPATLSSPSHAGLYPAGEGAGYAGGIVSSAMDGMRIADAVLGGL